MSSAGPRLAGTRCRPGLRLCGAETVETLAMLVSLPRRSDDTPGHPVCRGQCGTMRPRVRPSFPTGAVCLRLVKTRPFPTSAEMPSRPVSGHRAGRPGHAPQRGLRSSPARSRQKASPKSSGGAAMNKTNLARLFRRAGPCRSLSAHARSGVMDGVASMRGRIPANPTRS